MGVRVSAGWGHGGGLGSDPRVQMQHFDCPSLRALLLSHVGLFATLWTASSGLYLEHGSAPDSPHCI